MNIYVELDRARSNIRNMELQLIRLRTGRKAIEQYNIDKADWIVERIIEIRKYGAKLVEQIKQGNVA